MPARKSSAKKRSSKRRASSRRSVRKSASGRRAPPKRLVHRSAYELLTIPQLQRVCKRRGYANYSNLDKKGLVKMCIQGIPPRHTSMYYTRSALKRTCKAQGVKQFSHLPKKKLFRKCRPRGAPLTTPHKLEALSKDVLYKKAQVKKIKGRSMMSKAQLIRALRMHH